MKIEFLFEGKKIGHRLKPGRYSAVMLKTRINKAGNLEMTLKDVCPMDSSSSESISKPA